MPHRRLLAAAAALSMVTASALPAVAQDEDFEPIDNSACADCHETGKDGAPRTGSWRRWRDA